MTEFSQNTVAMKFVADLSPILENIFLKKKSFRKIISDDNNPKLLNLFFDFHNGRFLKKESKRMSRVLSVLVFDLISISISSVNPRKDFNNQNKRKIGKLNREEEHRLMSSEIYELLNQSKTINQDLPLFSSNLFSLFTLFRIILSDYEATRVLYDFYSSNPFRGEVYLEFYTIYILDEGISVDKKNQHGIVFTPKEIAVFLSRNVLNSQTETIIDPAAGSGVLLLEALKILAKNPEFKVRHIIGIEKDTLLALICESALKYYSRILSLPNIDFQVINDDFFDCSDFLRNIQENTKKKISILMNPPYTRQELMIKDHKKGFLKKVSKSESLNEYLLHNPNFQVSGQSGLYIYFILFISQFLRNGDRIGLIIPNSWMNTRYGSSFQQYLLAFFHIELLVTSLNQKFIPSVEVNTVILVLRYRKFSSKQEIGKDSYKIKAVTVGDRADLKNILKQSDIDSNNTTLDFTVQNIEEEDLQNTNKWGMYIRCPPFFRKLLGGNRVEMDDLSEYVKIHRGFTSGANDFFYLGKPGTANRYFRSEIDEKNGHLILTPKSPEISFIFEDQGFRFSIRPLRIEKEYWMHPIKKSEFLEGRTLHYTSQDGQIFVPNYIIKSPKELLSFKVREEHLNLIVVLIPPVGPSMLKPEVMRYIAWAESFQPLSGEKINRKKTCASRKYWYSLPVEKNRNDLLLCMMTINDRFSFFFNPKNYYIDARLYGINIVTNEKQVEKLMIPFLFLYLNSVVVSLQIELLGRANLGEGGLDVKVYEYLSLRIPAIRIFNSLENDSLNTIFTQAVIQPSLSINAAKDLPIQKIFDNFLLQINLVTPEELTEIVQIFQRFVQNRLGKARSQN